MRSNTAVEWLHSFPAQLSAVTLFAPFDEVGSFYKEKVVEVDAAEKKVTVVGMEFLNFRSGARIAKKHKTSDQTDDESGFRRKTYMIPTAFPGIIVKDAFLRKLPLLHHCVFIRTGTILVQNPYKISTIDQTNPGIAALIARFEMHNNTYPIYRILRREVSVLPLRQMANLITPAMPGPERAKSPEYAGEFRPFSFVDADNAVGFLTLYRRRRKTPIPKLPTNDDGEVHEDARFPPTTLWAERRAADPEWGVPVLRPEYLSPTTNNPVADLIKETIGLMKRYSSFPCHVPEKRQRLAYQDVVEGERGAPTQIRLLIRWKSLLRGEMDRCDKEEDRGEFVRTIMLSFLTSRPNIMMQLEAASLGVLHSIVRDITENAILASAAFIWKNNWSFELQVQAYPTFKKLCNGYFGKIIFENGQTLSVTEKDRGACIRYGTVMHYEKFAIKQEKDDYAHMYELLDLTYRLRDNPDYMRVVFREKIMYVAPCPWTKKSSWIVSTWSDFDMARGIADWLMELSRKTVRFVPYKHREMGDIVAQQEADNTSEDDDTPKVKLTEDMPLGTVLFDEELYQQLLKDRIFITYEGARITLSDEQLSAVRALKESPLNVILGDPGTGKSTMFQVFLKLFGVENVHICCAYNTMASMHARTALYSTSIDSANARFTHYTDPRKVEGVESTARVRVLIIDEVGVVKLNHARMLYNVYKPDIVIFAGDINQMKAIGRGEILRGLMDVFEDNPKITTTLTVAHRANAGIARVHIANCLKYIKMGQGERIYGLADRIAGPPISFLSHRGVNSGTHVEFTLKSLIDKFRNDRDFWTNFIGICRTHDDRRKIQEFILKNSPLTQDIVAKRGYLGRRDLAIGEILKVTSRFKPYERKAPPLVPPELGTSSLMRVSRVLDVFTDGPMGGKNPHLAAVLGGYLSKEELSTHLSEIEVDDLETTLSPTKVESKSRKRARLIILDDGLASFILTENTRECYERGNVVTVASIQGGQFDNVLLWLTYASDAGGVNFGAFTEEKSMLYTGSSRAKKRIIYAGSKAMVGEISRRIERPRRNLFTAIIRQMACIKPFNRDFDGADEFKLPLHETDYVKYERR